MPASACVRWYGVRKRNSVVVLNQSLDSDQHPNNIALSFLLFLVFREVSLLVITNF